MASPQCFAKPPTLNPAGGDGRVLDGFGGIAAYVVGSIESKARVILVSDIFGYEAPNLRYTILHQYLLVQHRLASRVPGLRHSSPVKWIVLGVLNTVRGWLLRMLT